jgi:hypothetical protein
VAGVGAKGGSVLGDGVVGDRVVEARAIEAVLERAGVTEVGGEGDSL